jgi:hypothetical protein
MFKLGSPGGKMAQVGEATATEMMTEWGQELFEYFGTVLGTKKDVDVVEAFNQANIAAFAGAGTGGGISLTVQGYDAAHEALSARAAEKQMKKFNEGLKDVDMENDPTVREHIKNVFKDNGAESVWVDVDPLQSWLSENGGDMLVQALNIEGDMATSAHTLTPVEISIDALVDSVVGTDMFDALLPHLMYKPGSMSSAESHDFLSKDLQKELALGEEADIREEIETSDDVVVDQAQKTVAVNGMVKSAEEAGYTKEEFAAYNKDREAARLETKKRKDVAVKEKALSKNAKKIREKRKAAIEKVEPVIAQQNTYRSRQDTVDTVPT